MGGNKIKIHHLTLNKNKNFNFVDSKIFYLIYLFIFLVFSLIISHLKIDPSNRLNIISYFSIITLITIITIIFIFITFKKKVIY